MHIAIRKNYVHMVYYLSFMGCNTNLTNKKNENLRNLLKGIDLKLYINDYYN
jgi:hypothetical protein